MEFFNSYQTSENKQLTEQLSIMQKKNAALIQQCNEWYQKNTELTQLCNELQTKNADLIQKCDELRQKSTDLESSLILLKTALKTSKERIGKGKNTKISMDNYTVIDLETTSKYVTDCEVIEMAAVRVRNGEIADTFSTLVKPAQKISAVITRITGISNDMVADAPSCRDALQKYLDFIGDDIVVGHNILSFDCNIIYDLCLQYLGILFGNNMVDTYQLAYDCNLPVSDLKLTTLTAHFGIEHDQAHRALADCIANYHCYERMKPLQTNDYRFQATKNRYGTKPSRTTQDLLELLDLVQKITADKSLSDDEIKLLTDWINAHRDLEGNYPYDVISRKLSEILEDKLVTEDERAELLSLLDEQSDPVKHRADDCADGIDFCGKRVCLTGQFVLGSRDKISTMLEKAGAIIVNTVTSKTDCLIVGSCGSSEWSCGNYGTKVKRALELQGKGKPIKIFSEEVALKCLTMKK